MAKRLPVLLALSLLVACSTPPAPPPVLAPLPAGEEASARLLEEGKALLAPVEEYLGPIEPGAVGFGILPTWAVLDLNSAYRLFRDSYFAAPDAPWAAEALFLAGRCHDFPFLQQFETAAENYRQAMERFPEGEYGRKARERYSNLTSKTRGWRGSPPLP